MSLRRCSLGVCLSVHFRTAFVCSRTYCPIVQPMCSIGGNGGNSGNSVDADSGHSGVNVVNASNGIDATMSMVWRSGDRGSRENGTPMALQ